MVLMRSLRSLSRAATSRGTAALAINFSAGLEVVGTRKFFLTLAAAEVAMALSALGSGAAPSIVPMAGTGPVLVLTSGEFGRGMRMVSEQLGQSISSPAPEASTANSCSHLGQLKIRSIK